jgi:hypothetical protein
LARLELPKLDEHLAESLDTELRASEQEMGLNLIHWRVIDGYLRGARKFTVLDRLNGKLRYGFDDFQGGIPYRHEDIVRRYLVEVGRWMRSDLSPVARRKGESLDDMRNAAIAKAVLMSRASKIDIKALRQKIIVPYIKYGLVGLMHHETGNPLHPDHIEVVPARQLRGLPAFCEGTENLQGIARVRWVPYDWIKNQLARQHGINLDKFDIETDLYGRRIAWGQTPPGATLFNDTGFVNMGGMSEYSRGPRLPAIETSLSKRTRMESSDDITSEGRYYVQVEEVYPYMDDPTYAAAYILKIGRKIIHKESFETERVVCPLQAIRYTDTGAFFSRGFVAPLIPANDQFERVISSVGRNLQETDMFGTTYLSAGMNIDIKELNKPGPRPKFAKYNADPLNTSLQPIAIQPTNPGLMPVRFAEFLTGVTEKLAGQGPFYDGQAAGRMDSAAGHGFLFNTGNVGLGLQSHNLADAVSNIYKRVLQVAKDTLSSGDTIKMTLVDDALAGVVFDPRTNEASLAENPIPNVWDVDIDVKDRTPRDPDIRKQELKEMHAGGLLGADPDTSFLQFWITVWEEGLDILGGPKDIYETWRKVIWQIILLFNDGETPGPVEFGEHTQNPTVQLLALTRFMNKIEFSLSSEAVQLEFEKWKNALEQLTGTNYPAGLEAPEDIAMTGGPSAQPQPGVTGMEGMMGGGDFSQLMATSQQ